MGNTIVPMYKQLIANNTNDSFKDLSNINPVKKENTILFNLKNKLFSRYFFSNKVFVNYLIRIGLTKQQARSYLNI